MSESYRLATFIVQTLQQAGFFSLFAGGWVRDYLLGIPSQDIDIATTAHPDQVITFFPHAITVGAQFGVVRVRLKGHEFEIASFRSDDQYLDGRRPSQVHFSTPEQDAQRRDFTINGIFYDPLTATIHDYVGGENDLKARRLKTIGNPKKRFEEDRLRILRAIRFKHSLQFTIEEHTWKAICDASHTIFPSVSPERVWQELQKMHKKAILAPALYDMEKSGLLYHLFPMLTTIPKSKTYDRIRLLRSYTGASLSAAIALLLHDLLKNTDIAEHYHLSRKERYLFDTARQLFEFLNKKRHTEEAYVILYTLPAIDQCLESFSLLKPSPQRFLAYHRHRQKKLRFWIEQLRHKKFLITGKDAAQFHIAPGKKTGQFIKHAFRLSLQHKITNKDQLFLLLQNE